MAKYMLFALNGPTEGAGDEATYNAWYHSVHMPDLLALDGVIAARRFKAVSSNRIDWPYVATYEIESDDIDSVLREMRDNIRPFSPTFDRSKSGMVLAMEITDQ
ncbi:DUF4286 family protein [Sphingomonas psychrolutea]|uniref:EthD domain-containing protein n=1 Tax=Sphingomonas psychrolutea TaxID=1259676 RepID=A0ABQ1G5W0_9SPHN|nr:DUF4286 family protein [Sphingomonas psychrolutea]GGA37066.1 hypothetical protein GCM10011395_04210 [Sphingomonas psychrolutea]